nr:unknown [Lotus japonicus]
MVILHL